MNTAPSAALRALREREGRRGVTGDRVHVTIAMTQQDARTFLDDSAEYGHTLLTSVLENEVAFDVVKVEGLLA